MLLVSISIIAVRKEECFDSRYSIQPLLVETTHELLLEEDDDVAIVKADDRFMFSQVL